MRRKQLSDKALRRCAEWRPMAHVSDYPSRNGKMCLVRRRAVDWVAAGRKQEKKAVGLFRESLELAPIDWVTVVAVA